MVDRAHDLGLTVIPWTVSLGFSGSLIFATNKHYSQVNRLNIAEQLLDFKVDGIITDFSTNIRFLVKNAGFKIRPVFDANVVEKCLNKHLQLATT